MVNSTTQTRQFYRIQVFHNFKVILIKYFFQKAPKDETISNKQENLGTKDQLKIKNSTKAADVRPD